MRFPAPTSRWTALATLVCALMFSAASSATAWIYDGSPIYNRGAGVGAGMSSQMVAQPVIFPWTASVNEIGLAVAQGQDPNHAGFRITIATDPWHMEQSSLGSWTLYPVQGPVFAFAYVSVQPIIFPAGQTYYVTAAPGDPQFAGAVAFAYHGYPALATNDNGQTWSTIPQLGLRLGGGPVPEPRGLQAMSATIAALCAARARQGAKKRPARE